MALVTVKRTDHPERVDKRGSEPKVYPAFYECSYRAADGRELAKYYSDRDALWLRTDFIGTDFDKSYTERALTCPKADAYREIFDSFPVMPAKISEYTYA